MNTAQLKLKGNWNQVKGAIREKFGDLTDNDLEQVKGQEEQLLGMLQQKTGKTREEITTFFKENDLLEK